MGSRRHSDDIQASCFNNDSNHRLSILNLIFNEPPTEAGMNDRVNTCSKLHPDEQNIIRLSTLTLPSVKFCPDHLFLLLRRVTADID